MAFKVLVGPHPRALHLHTYRMLGSLDDPDKALQDALLRAWLTLDTYRGQVPLSHWHITGGHRAHDRHDPRPLNLPIDRRWRAELEHLPMILAITRASTLQQIVGDPAQQR